MGRLSPLSNSLTLGLVLLFLTLFMPNNAAPVTESASRYANEKGCYFMNKHYDTGHEIETNDPCMNCTCTGAAMMCYLRICPFVKPLGENCHMEKHVGDCCPRYWCPEVYPRVTSPRPESEAKGCYLNGMHYEEGSRLPVDPFNPCHACYCIRNVSVCTNATCELHIPGCYPQYKIGSCCPASYVCTDEAATTIPPTALDSEVPPGCNVSGILYDDGAEVPSNESCKKCYCMRHQVMCTAMECTVPGTNCVPHEVPDGQCCPEKYDCPQDTEITDFSTTHMISSEEEFYNLTTTHMLSSTVSTTSELIEDKTFNTLEGETAYPTTKGIRRIDDDGIITMAPTTDVPINQGFATEADLTSRPRVPKITDVPDDMFTTGFGSRVTTGKPLFYPSRPIPGEGICRFENKTYQNREEVMSSDPCRVNCTCVNSVVLCERVECVLKPPESGANCKVKKIPDECCPKYVCDITSSTSSSNITETPEQQIIIDVFTKDILLKDTVTDISLLTKKEQDVTTVIPKSITETEISKETISDEDLIKEFGITTELTSQEIQTTVSIEEEDRSITETHLEAETVHSLVSTTEKETTEIKVTSDGDSKFITDTKETTVVRDTTLSSISDAEITNVTKKDDSKMTTISPEAENITSTKEIEKATVSLEDDTFATKLTTEQVKITTQQQTLEKQTIPQTDESDQTMMLDVQTVMSTLSKKEKEGTTDSLMPTSEGVTEEINIGVDTDTATFTADEKDVTTMLSEKDEEDIKLVSKIISDEQISTTQFSTTEKEIEITVTPSEKLKTTPFTPSEVETISLHVTEIGGESTETLESIDHKKDTTVKIESITTEMPFKEKIEDRTTQTEESRITTQIFEAETVISVEDVSKTSKDDDMKKATTIIKERITTPVSDVEEKEETSPKQDIKTSTVVTEVIFDTVKVTATPGDGVESTDITLPTSKTESISKLPTTGVSFEAEETNKTMSTISKFEEVTPSSIVSKMEEGTTVVLEDNRVKVDAETSQEISITTTQLSVKQTEKTLSQTEDIIFTTVMSEAETASPITTTEFKEVEKSTTISDVNKILLDTKTTEELETITEGSTTAEKMTEVSLTSKKVGETISTTVEEVTILSNATESNLIISTAFMKDDSETTVFEQSTTDKTSTKSEDDISTTSLTTEDISVKIQEAEKIIPDIKTSTEVSITTQILEDAKEVTEEKEHINKSSDFTTVSKMFSLETTTSISKDIDNITMPSKTDEIVSMPVTVEERITEDLRTTKDIEKITGKPDSVESATLSVSVTDEKITTEQDILFTKVQSETESDPSTILDTFRTTVKEAEDFTPFSKETEIETSTEVTDFEKNTISSEITSEEDNLETVTDEESERETHTEITITSTAEGISASDVKEVDAKSTPHPGENIFGAETRIPQTTVSSTDITFKTASTTHDTIQEDKTSSETGGISQTTEVTAKKESAAKDSSTSGLETSSMSIEPLMTEIATKLHFDTSSVSESSTIAKSMETDDIFVSTKTDPTETIQIKDTVLTKTTEFSFADTTPQTELPRDTELDDGHKKSTTVPGATGLTTKLDWSSPSFTTVTSTVLPIRSTEDLFETTELQTKLTEIPAAADAVSKTTFKTELFDDENTSEAITSEKIESVTSMHTFSTETAAENEAAIFSTESSEQMPTQGSATVKTHSVSDGDSATEVITTSDSLHESTSSVKETSDTFSTSVKLDSATKESTGLLPGEKLEDKTKEPEMASSVFTESSKSVFIDMTTKIFETQTDLSASGEETETTSDTKELFSEKPVENVTDITDSQRVTSFAPVEKETKSPTLLDEKITQIPEMLHKTTFQAIGEKTSTIHHAVTNFTELEIETQTDATKFFDVSVSPVMFITTATNTQSTEGEITISKMLTEKTSAVPVRESDKSKITQPTETSTLTSFTSRVTEEPKEVQTSKTEQALPDHISTATERITPAVLNITTTERDSDEDIHTLKELDHTFTTLETEIVTDNIFTAKTHMPDSLVKEQTTFIEEKTKGTSGTSPSDSFEERSTKVFTDTTERDFITQEAETITMPTSKFPDFHTSTFESASSETPSPETATASTTDEFISTASKFSTSTEMLTTESISMNASDSTSVETDTKQPAADDFEKEKTTLELLSEMFTTSIKGIRDFTTFTTEDEKFVTPETTELLNVVINQTKLSTDVEIITDATIFSSDEKTATEVGTETTLNEFMTKEPGKVETPQLFDSKTTETKMEAEVIKTSTDISLEKFSLIETEKQTSTFSISTEQKSVAEESKLPSTINRESISELTTAIDTSILSTQKEETAEIFTSTMVPSEDDKPTSDFEGKTSTLKQLSEDAVTEKHVTEKTLITTKKLQTEGTVTLQTEFFTTETSVTEEMKITSAATQPSIEVSEPTETGKLSTDIRKEDFSIVDTEEEATSSISTTHEKSKTTAFIEDETITKLTTMAEPSIPTSKISDTTIVHGQESSEVFTLKITGQSDLTATDFFESETASTKEQHPDVTVTEQKHTEENFMPTKGPQTTEFTVLISKAPDAGISETEKEKETFATSETSTSDILEESTVTETLKPEVTTWVSEEKTSPVELEKEKTVLALSTEHEKSPEGLEITTSMEGQTLSKSTTTQPSVLSTKLSEITPAQTEEISETFISTISHESDVTSVISLEAETATKEELPEVSGLEEHTGQSLLPTKESPTTETSKPPTSEKTESDEEKITFPTSKTTITDGLETSIQEQTIETSTAVTEEKMTPVDFKETEISSTSLAIEAGTDKSKATVDLQDQMISKLTTAAPSSVPTTKVMDITSLHSEETSEAFTLTASSHSDSTATNLLEAETASTQEHPEVLDSDKQHTDPVLMTTKEPQTAETLTLQSKFSTTEKSMTDAKDMGFPTSQKPISDVLENTTDEEVVKQSVDIPKEKIIPVDTERTTLLLTGHDLVEDLKTTVSAVSSQSDTDSFESETATGKEPLSEVSVTEEKHTERSMMTTKEPQLTKPTTSQTKTHDAEISVTERKEETPSSQTPLSDSIETSTQTEIMKVSTDIPKEKTTPVEMTKETAFEVSTEQDTSSKKSQTTVMEDQTMSESTTIVESLILSTKFTEMTTAQSEKSSEDFASSTASFSFEAETKFTTDKPLEISVMEEQHTEQSIKLTKEPQTTEPTILQSKTDAETSVSERKEQTLPTSRTTILDSLDISTQAEAVKISTDISKEDTTPIVGVKETAVSTKELKTTVSFEDQTMSTLTTFAKPSVLSTKLTETVADSEEPGEASTSTIDHEKDVNSTISFEAETASTERQFLEFSETDVSSTDQSLLSTKEPEAAETEKISKFATEETSATEPTDETARTSRKPFPDDLEADTKMSTFEMVTETLEEKVSPGKTEETSKVFTTAFSQSDLTSTLSFESETESIQGQHQEVSETEKPQTEQSFISTKEPLTSETVQLQSKSSTAETSVTDDKDLTFVSTFKPTSDGLKLRTQTEFSTEVSSGKVSPFETDVATTASSISFEKETSTEELKTTVIQDQTISKVTTAAESSILTTKTAEMTSQNEGVSTSAVTRQNDVATTLLFEAETASIEEHFQNETDQPPTEQSLISTKELQTTETVTLQTKFSGSETHVTEASKEAETAKFSTEVSKAETSPFDTGKETTFVVSTESEALAEGPMTTVFLKSQTMTELTTVVNGSMLSTSIPDKDMTTIIPVVTSKITDDINMTLSSRLPEDIDTVTIPSSTVKTDEMLSQTTKSTSKSFITEATVFAETTSHFSDVTEEKLDSEPLSTEKAKEDFTTFEEKEFTETKSLPKSTTTVDIEDNTTHITEIKPEEEKIKPSTIDAETLRTTAIIVDLTSVEQQKSSITKSTLVTEAVTDRMPEKTTVISDREEVLTKLPELITTISPEKETEEKHMISTPKAEATETDHTVITERTVLSNVTFAADAMIKSQTSTIETSTSDSTKITKLDDFITGTLQAMTPIATSQTFADTDETHISEMTATEGVVSKASTFEIDITTMELDSTNEITESTTGISGETEKHLTEEPVSKRTSLKEESTTAAVEDGSFDSTISIRLTKEDEPAVTQNTTTMFKTTITFDADKETSAETMSSQSFIVTDTVTESPEKNITFDAIKTTKPFDIDDESDDSELPEGFFSRRDEKIDDITTEKKTDVPSMISTSEMSEISLNLQTEETKFTVEPTVMSIQTKDFTSADSETTILHSTVAEKNPEIPAIGMTESDVDTKIIFTTPQELPEKVETKKVFDGPITTETPTTQKETITLKSTFDEETVSEEEDTIEKTTCIVNNTSYNDGEAITTINACEKCHCSLGEIRCFKIICKQPQNGCIPKANSTVECCPTSYECPEGEMKADITTTMPFVSERDLSTPIPISFMFSAIPTSIASTILVTKSDEEPETGTPIHRDSSITLEDVETTSDIHPAHVDSATSKPETTASAIPSTHVQSSTSKLDAETTSAILSTHADSATSKLEEVETTASDIHLAPVDSETSKLEDVETTASVIHSTHVHSETSKPEDVTTTASDIHSTHVHSTTSKPEDVETTASDIHSTHVHSTTSKPDVETITSAIQSTHADSATSKLEEVETTASDIHLAPVDSETSKLEDVETTASAIHSTHVDSETSKPEDRTTTASDIHSTHIHSTTSKPDVETITSAIQSTHADSATSKQKDVETTASDIHSTHVDSTTSKSEDVETTASAIHSTRVDSETSKPEDRTTTASDIHLTHVHSTASKLDVETITSAIQSTHADSSTSKQEDVETTASDIHSTHVDSTTSKSVDVETTASAIHSTHVDSETSKPEDITTTASDIHLTHVHSTVSKLDVETITSAIQSTHADSTTSKQEDVETTASDIHSTHVDSETSKPEDRTTIASAIHSTHVDSTTSKPIDVETTASDILQMHVDSSISTFEGVETSASDIHLSTIASKIATTEATFDLETLTDSDLTEITILTSKEKADESGQDLSTTVEDHELSSLFHDIKQSTETPTTFDTVKTTFVEEKEKITTVLSSDTSQDPIKDLNLTTDLSKPTTEKIFTQETEVSIFEHEKEFVTEKELETKSTQKIRVELKDDIFSTTKEFEDKITTKLPTAFEEKETVTEMISKVTETEEILSDKMTTPETRDLSKEKTIQEVEVDKSTTEIKDITSEMFTTPLPSKVPKMDELLTTEAELKSTTGKTIPSFVKERTMVTQEKDEEIRTSPATSQSSEEAISITTEDMKIAEKSETADVESATTLFTSSKRPSLDVETVTDKKLTTLSEIPTKTSGISLKDETDVVTREFSTEEIFSTTKKVESDTSATEAVTLFSETSPSISKDTTDHEEVFHFSVTKADESLYDDRFITSHPVQEISTAFKQNTTDLDSVTEVIETNKTMSVFDRQGTVVTQEKDEEIRTSPVTFQSSEEAISITTEDIKIAETTDGESATTFFTSSKSPSLDIETVSDEKLDETDVVTRELSTEEMFSTTLKVKSDTSATEAVTLFSETSPSIFENTSDHAITAKEMESEKFSTTRDEEDTLFTSRKDTDTSTLSSKIPKTSEGVTSVTDEGEDKSEKSKIVTSVTGVPDKIFTFVSTRFTDLMKGITEFTTVKSEAETTDTSMKELSTPSELMTKIEENVTPLMSLTSKTDSELDVSTTKKSTSDVEVTLSPIPKDSDTKISTTKSEEEKSASDVGFKSINDTDMPTTEIDKSSKDIFTTISAFMTSLKDASGSSVSETEKSVIVATETSGIDKSKELGSIEKDAETTTKHSVTDILSTILTEKEEHPITSEATIIAQKNISESFEEKSVTESLTSPTLLTRTIPSKAISETSFIFDQQTTLQTVEELTKDFTAHKKQTEIIETTTISLPPEILKTEKEITTKTEASVITSATEQGKDMEIASRGTRKDVELEITLTPFTRAKVDDQTLSTIESLDKVTTDGTKISSEDVASTTITEKLVTITTISDEQDSIRSTDKFSTKILPKDSKTTITTLMEEQTEIPTFSKTMTSNVSLIETSPTTQKPIEDAEEIKESITVPTTTKVKISTIDVSTITPGTTLEITTPQIADAETVTIISSSEESTFTQEEIRTTKTEVSPESTLQSKISTDITKSVTSIPMLETMKTTKEPKLTTLEQKAETSMLPFTEKSIQTNTTDHQFSSETTTIISKDSSSTEHVTKGYKAIDTTTVKEDEDYILDENTCIFEGRIYQSAEQIPRADPCEFCFCFRGDIICLQQSCPPPAPNCHQTTIPGYCCPRYECPVYMTSKNITALSRRKGGVTPIIIQRRIDKREIRPTIEVKGCQINGTFYEFGKTVTSASGPCLHCVCQEDGLMHCDPRRCKPEAPLMLKMNNSYFRRR